MRGPRLAQPPSFRRSLPLSSHKPFSAPRLYRSNLSDAVSKKDYREDWVKVIEEYKKDKKQLARDLGAAESIDSIHMERNKQLAQELEIANSGREARKKPFMTMAGVVESIAGDVIGLVLLAVASYFYYTLTGKERLKPEDKKVADKEPAAEQGVEIWFGEPEGEEKWQGQDG
jgi:hypothetical protein